jgi:hypothetical protein
MLVDPDHDFGDDALPAPGECSRVIGVSDVHAEE